MKKHMNFKNELFNKALTEDKLPISPDSKTESRLNYYYNLQHSSQRIHSNGFASFFTGLLVGKTFLLKTAALAVFISFLFIKSPVNKTYSKLTCDTSASHFMYVDTNSMIKDTCFN